jgi:hypothetical protein
MFSDCRREAWMTHRFAGRPWDVFTSSAQPWDHLDPTVQKHPHGPPF